jgi:hypothetical protein
MHPGPAIEAVPKLALPGGFELGNPTFLVVLHLSPPGFVVTIRPPGLLAGIAALTPAGSGPSKGEVLVDDLQALGVAIAAVAGNGDIILVASPDAAVPLAKTNRRTPAAHGFGVLGGDGRLARALDLICLGGGRSFFLASHRAAARSASKVCKLDRRRFFPLALFACPESRHTPRASWPELNATVAEPPFSAANRHSIP